MLFSSARIAGAQTARQTFCHLRAASRSLYADAMPAEKRGISVLTIQAEAEPCFKGNDQLPALSMSNSRLRPPGKSGCFHCSMYQRDHSLPCFLKIALRMVTSSELPLPKACCRRPAWRADSDAPLPGVPEAQRSGWRRSLRRKPRSENRIRCCSCNSR